MDVIILLALIFLNGLFVMSEIALVSARKTWLENQADKGNEAARVALELANNPEIFLSAAQIGITAISIVTGVYSGERFGHYLQPAIEKIHFLEHYAATISTTIVVIIVTFLSIILGELIPKRTGLMRAEKIATVMALPMYYFAKATHPIVWLLNKISNIYFQIVNLRPDKESNVTEEEIKAIISEGTEQGTIEEAEQEIIERVFHLSDRNITSLMTHRSEIIWFDTNDDENAIRNKIIEAPHSVYPVCDEGLDHIKGIVSLKDLYLSTSSSTFDKILRPAIFVPENITAYKLLEKFKSQRLSCCFIVDEYGSLEGMITITDILEAILGELPQLDEETYEIMKREDGSYLTDAQIPFYDFLSYFQRADWMNEGGHEFDTLAGFILHQLERIPHTGDKLAWRAFTFEIVDMDAQRIDKVLVTISDDIREDMDTGA